MNPIPSPSASAAPAPRPERALRTYSAFGFTRVIGYGLVALFLIDMPSIAALYLQNPFDPQMDGTAISQILERVGVAILGFAFIFGWESHDLPRGERILRKFLSQMTLVASLICLALGGLAISSAVRNYSRAATVLDFRANQRVAALTQLGKQINSVTGQVLRTTYDTIAHPDPKAPIPDVPEMRRQIAAGMPAAVDAVYATVRLNKSQGKRQEMLSAGKYALTGVITAALFFILWEGTSQARTYRIFRQRNAPGLGVEGAIVGGLANVGRKMESIRILPDPESWSWYRRIRRKWRHRKEKRDR